MSEKLLPCPFCGGEPVWCGEHGPIEEHHECDQIVCPHCKFNFDLHGKVFEEIEGFAAARKVALEAWNTRAQTPPPAVLPVVAIPKRVTIADARDYLNTNDKAFWVTGWNECVESIAAASGGQQDRGEG